MLIWYLSKMASFNWILCSSVSISISIEKPELLNLIAVPFFQMRCGVPYESQLRLPYCSGFLASKIFVFAVVANASSW